jgi:hypothetical protein
VRGSGAVYAVEPKLDDAVGWQNRRKS